MTTDPYRIWLGIPKDVKNPNYYNILGIAQGESNVDVIRSAIEQRRFYIQSKRSQGDANAANQILGLIDEAAATLLVPDFKHGYDRHIGLHLKSKSGKRTAYLLPEWMESRVVRVYGEGSGLIAEVLGLVAILFGAFALMALFSFQLPWQKIANDDEAPATPPERMVGEPNAPKTNKSRDVDELAKSKTNQPLPDKPPVSFLVTLPRIEVRPHPNNWWSDQGELVLGGINGKPFVRKPLMFDGRPSPHGIYMSGLSSSEVFVKYRLDGRFERFESTVHVPDMLENQGDPRAPLVFSVVGDGKTLWQSKELTKKGEHQPCIVSIKGVKELRLTIACKGQDNWALGAWIEPQVSQATAGQANNKLSRNIPSDKKTPQSDAFESLAAQSSSTTSTSGGQQRIQSQLQGRWKCVSEFGMSDSQLQDMNKRLEIAGDKFTISRKKNGEQGVSEGRFRMTDAKEFDWTGTATDGRLKEWVGIYSWDQKILKLCYRTGEQGTNVQRATWADQGSKGVTCVEFLREGDNFESQASSQADAPFKKQSVWSEGDLTMTIIERNAETFKAKFETKEWSRIVEGTIKGAKVTWLAKDVQPIKGGSGGDNFGTISKDERGYRMDVEWKQANGKSGTSTLRLNDRSVSNKKDAK